MKLHHLLLALVISLPLLFSNSSRAWSPLDELGQSVDSLLNCEWRVVSESDSGEGEQEEPEQEIERVLVES